MLLAFVILAMGAWELLYEGSSEGWQTLIVGGAILLIGFFVASWEIWFGGVTLRREEPSGAVPEKTSPPPPAEVKAGPARFTIHQTGDDTAVDRAQRILEADPRITSIVEEGGRWYSVPDGDDLPEWNALRIYCEVDDLDAFMEEVSETLKTQLSASDYGKLTIAHY